MTALEHEVLRHWSLYLDGRPEISDAAFDALVEQLRRLDATSSVLSFLGHTGSSPHEKPMRSLQKVKSEEAVNKWISAIKTTDLRVMPKFDGLAVSLKYVQGTLVRATTRGDGRFGEDITRHIVRLPSVPRKVSNLTGEVRGEIVLRRSRLADLGGATCRNVAVGLIGRDETSQSHMLDFIPWGVVGGAFRTFDETIAWLHSQYPNQAPCIPYTYDAAVQLITEPGDVDRDGAVIVVNDFALRERLGETDHHPRWAVALKLATESQSTTVRKLEWQVGRTGVVTPVVVIDEVEVDGVNITRVTGHNAQTIVEKGIGPGAIVSITRRGGVIPHIEDVTLKAAVRIPTTCGECGGALKFTGRTLTHEGCPAAQRAGKPEVRSCTSGRPNHAACSESPLYCNGGASPGNHMNELNPPALSSKGSLAWLRKRQPHGSTPFRPLGGNQPNGSTEPTEGFRSQACPAKLNSKDLRNDRLVLRSTPR